MKKIKTYAKLNITLDVVGKKGGFHLLDSLVCSLSLFNEGKFVKRKDKEINIRFIGEPIGCCVKASKAYLSAKAFVEKYNTLGADIIIKRNIPTGAGLGGSSSDVATVLNGLNELYKVNADLKDLANEFGSDSFYMLNGGYKRLKGRGDVLENLDIKKRLYFLILTSDKGVSTKECFFLCDKQSKKPPCTEKVIKAFLSGEYEKGLKQAKNDLYGSAIKLLPTIKEKFNDLKDVGSAVMTGSGSSVLGIYESKRERKKALIKLKKKYKKITLAKSV